MARFGLPMRLLGLLAVAILPAMAALIYVQVELRHERSERVADGALHQAELLAADVETLVDAARQLTLAVVQLDTTQTFNRGCANQLNALQHSLASYAMLEVVGTDGQVICATTRATSPPAAFQADIAATVQSGHFLVGHYVVLPGQMPVLPMMRPFAGVSGRRGVVVAAIDLEWLRSHLQRFHINPNNSVNVSDGAGTVLMRLPGDDRWRGHRIVAAAQDLLGAQQAGTRELTGLDAVHRVIGYVPPAVTGGLFVSCGIYLPDLLVGIDRAAQRGYLLIGGGALLSLLLMVVITQRLVHAPTEALLRAAQRWSDGDLAARAMPDVSSANEFGRLAGAFNSMAETLDIRRRELQELNASLEVRVSERTHALSETNNRLLVEINERERTDAALRQAQKLQAVGQLAGGVAHEFNNLLTTVMGALELLRLKADAPLQRYVDAALMASRRGANLTSQLLAFSRRKRLMPVAIDLNATLGEMHALLNSSLGKITLRIEPAAELWHALSDRQEIESAILSLAFNARDAMADGGTVSILTRNTRLGAGVGRAPGDYVELVMTDDGAGMTDEELAHAVDPFFTTKGPSEGAGLGLSQVHGLVQQLGGDLQIASVKGRGTTVSLFLPRALAAAAAERVGCGNDRCGRLLLVDDDAQVRQITADMLSEIGYDVLVAAGGKEALSILAAQRCQALVADYSMPEMTGIELIRGARRLDPGLVTLMITGYMDFAGTPDAELLEPQEVLRKPFTLSELAQRIDELRLRHAETV